MDDTTPTAAERTVLDEPEGERPLIVMGMLSSDGNYGLRMSQRRTWLSHPRFLHRFLLDRETPELLEEQKLHRDLVFLNATFSGAMKGFGEKLLLWLRYAHREFPHVPLIAKVDDDVYVCPDEMEEQLNKANHPRCYAGFHHAAGLWKKDNIVNETRRFN